MNYQVRLTETAEADYEERLSSLAERSPEAARKLHSRYLTALERVRTRPLSCGLAYENIYFPGELRHLLFWAYPNRKYRALYIVRGDQVVILAIRAPGEKPVKRDDLTAP
jgi:plasmid stabilization system protein ParE